MKFHPSVVENIEVLVRERQNAKARKEIFKYLRLCGKSTEAQVLAADWMRRLGLYKEGLQILKIQNFGQAGTTFAPAVLYKLAQILGLMGASEFAIQIIEGVPLRNSAECRSIGHIYLDLFEYEKALSLYLKAQELDLEPHSYTSRLALVSLADAYIGLEKYKAAHSLIDSILRITKEPLLLGILYQAQGEYYAREGLWRESLEKLNQARPYFPLAESTVDSAFLYKWLGYTLFRLGQKAQSRQYFLKAQAILKNPHLRPEAFLDLMRLKMILGTLKPSEQKTVCWYPGAPNGFIKLLPHPKKKVSFNSQKVSITINFSSNEYTQGKKIHYGIPLEWQLVGHLSIVGPWGLGLIRVKSLLWPGQVYSFIEQDNRLNSLLHRLRKHYGIKIDFSGGMLTLNPSSRKKIGVIQGDLMPPSFFRTVKNEFTRAMVGKYYRVGPSQAKEYIKIWTSKKWIESRGKAQAVRYKLL